MKKVVFHKYFWFFLCAVIIEQLLVASSTLWIGELSKAISEGRSFVGWGTGFILSLTLVYLPSTLKIVLLGLCKVQALEQYTLMFIASLRGQATLGRSQTFRQTREPFLKMEAWVTLDEWFDQLGFFLSLLFNVVFNVGSFVLLLGSQFGLAYAAVIPVLLLFHKHSSIKTDTFAKNIQESRCHLTHCLGSGWNNILIGNPLHLDFWKEKLRNALQSYRAGTRNNLLHLEVTTALSMFVSLFPVVGTIAFVAIKNQSNPAILLVLVATLPRHIQILQNLSDLMLFSLKFKGILVRVRGIENAASKPREEEQVQHRGSVDIDATILQREGGQISVRSAQENGVDLNTTGATGRVTIRGRNGCGKSTFLYALKEKMGSDALLIPADAMLASQYTFNQEHSTGQRIAVLLEEAMSNSKNKVLLLDEWDANLDDDHIKTLSKALDAFAKVGQVIEVRHRSGGLI